MIKLLQRKFVLVYFIVTVVALIITGQFNTLSAFFVLTYLITLLSVSYLFIKLKAEFGTSDQRLQPLLLCSMVVNASMFILSLINQYIKIALPQGIVLALSLLLTTLILWKTKIFFMMLVNDIKEKNLKMRKEFCAHKVEFENTLQESQDELESKVQERTLELHIALQELEDVNRELAEKTTVDDLTGLYNRRFYDQKILAEHRRSRRNLSPLCLIIIDIDHFKNVNDTHGHLVGDECLKSVAHKIKESLHRSSDLACRYGGEEFCLIMPETSADGALAFAEILRNKISISPVTHQGIEIPLTISCGIACYQQQDGATPETLFSAADQALYQAKHDGRNRVQLADPILLRRVEE